MSIRLIQTKMFTATPFVVITCVLLIMTVEGGYNRHVSTNGGTHKFDFKRDGNPTDKEVELLKAECLSLDIDPALGVTEDDVVTAFRKYDADSNGALLNAELGNFTSALEIYTVCETVNYITKE